MRTFLRCCLLLLLLWPTSLHAQGATPVGTASGRVQLLLLAANRQPVGGATASFVSEGQQPLATCTTDAAGRCTLLLNNAPADASGFIRGAIVVAGRGRKPLLWPGGVIAVELVLSESGQLDVPRDLYPTRTPNATETRAGTPGAVATVASTPTSAAFTPSATTTSPATTTLPPEAAASATLAPSPSLTIRRNSRQQQVGLALAAGLLLLVACYAWLGRLKETA